MRIVLFDDHMLFLEAIALALIERGQEVRIATSASTCIEEVLSFRPAVVTVDVGLPEGDVMTLVSKIASVAPRTAIVVLSGMDPTELAADLLRAGALGFLRKDESIDTILRSLELAAAGEPISLWRHPLREVKSPGRRAGPSRLRYLTPRELEVLNLISAGHSTKEMARVMGISYSTTRTHVQNVLQKLGVNSRLQAAALVDREAVVTRGYGRLGPSLIPVTYPEALHG